MEQVKIGWGRREISLDEPMSLLGQAYMRISQGIQDPMYVTALCIDGGDGEDAVIFLSVDGRSPTKLGEAGARAKKLCPDFPEDAVVPGGTHAHTNGAWGPTPPTSPDGQPIYSGEKYLEFTLDACAQALCEAWTGRKPGGIAYGYGYAVVGHSRRVCYFDDTSLRRKASPIAPNGHAIMYGNTADSQFSHYEAGADHFLNTLFTFDAAGELTGVLVNVPCPSQLSEHFTYQTADFWHEVREGVRAEFGERVYVLPQCAAAGDLAPRILHYKAAQERRMRLKYGLGYDPDGKHSQYNKVMAERYDIAERILEGIREVYGWASKDVKTRLPVRRISRNAELHRRWITDEERQWCLDNIENMKNAIPQAGEDPEAYRKAMSRYNIIKNRNQRVLDRYDIQKEDPCLHTMIHTVRIGEVAFATNRFELYQDFMHRIQARSPFLQTFVVQLAGFDGASYLPTRRGAENKGYSASIFCNVVGPEGGQELVDQTLQMLTELAEKE